jgi:hypothetical protein
MRIRASKLTFPNNQPSPERKQDTVEISFQAFKAAVAPLLTGKASADVDTATQAAWEKSGAYKYARHQNGRSLPVPSDWRAFREQFKAELAPKSKATTAPATKPAA